MILGKEIESQEPKIPFCHLNNTKHIFSSARLSYTVQKPVRTGFVLNNRNLQPLHYDSRRGEPSISINSIDGGLILSQIPDSVYFARQHI